MELSIRRPVRQFATLWLAALALVWWSPAALASAPAGATAAERQLYALFSEDTDANRDLDPLSALYRGIVPEPDAFAQLFTGRLETARDREAREALASIGKVDAARLGRQARISRAVFVWNKGQVLEPDDPTARAARQLRPLNHFSGLHVEYPQTVSASGPLPFRTAQDYRAVLALHEAFPQVLSNAEDRMREGLARGIVQPGHAVSLIIAQLDAILAVDPQASAFLTPLAEVPATIRSDEREVLRRAYLRVTSQRIYPAYRQLRAFLASEYFLKAQREPGLAAIPGGAPLYRRLIEEETTLALSPDEVHQLGLSEVGRIRMQMDQVRLHIAPEAPSLSQFFALIRNDARFHPESAAQLVFEYREIGERVDRMLPAYFERLPETPLRIVPYPASRAATEPGGAYYQAPADGQRPATFFFNTYDLASRYLTGMSTLYLHEALPGHHLQVALAHENDALPSFQRFGGNNAFIEGWALYAETLGHEMGLYDDPMQLWGHLDDEMLRAMRLVVDTGLHAKGWSRRQAIDYMLANSGIGRLDAEIEVDRYIAIPAQALSYKIGALTIQRLRQRAEKALGDRFDLKRFHSEVLGSGALPLPVLEAKIDAWIERERP